MHLCSLTDMYVLARARRGAYETLEYYETEVPKDVVQLHPGARVAVMVRWGPHRGEVRLGIETGL